MAVDWTAWHRHSMDMTASENFVLTSCTIDFDDVKVSLRLFSLSLNTSKVMMVFLIFSGQNLKNNIITLEAFRLKLYSLNEPCISSKSTIQLSRTIFSNSAIFMEKKRVENQLWVKSEFLWAIIFY